MKIAHQMWHHNNQRNNIHHLLNCINKTDQFVSFINNLQLNNKDNIYSYTHCFNIA